MRKQLCLCLIFALFSITIAGCSPNMDDDVGLVLGYFSVGEPSFIQMEVGSYQGGTAIIGPEDKAFWVKDQIAYAVNQEAIDTAPDLPLAPGTIQYDDAFIAAAMSDIESGAPVMDYSFGAGSLGAFDQLFSIPLCVFVLVVTLISCRKSWRCLLSLIPALLVITATFTVTHFVYPEALDFFGLDIINGTRLVSVYCLSLTVLWLAFGILAKCNVLMRIVLAFLVMACSGLIGLLNYANPAKGITELILMSVAVVFCIVMARRDAGSSPFWRHFMWGLLKYNLLVLSILWCAVSTYFDYSTYEYDAVIGLWEIPHAFTIGIVSALCLFAFETIFFLLGTVSTFHRERIKTVLGFNNTTSEILIQRKPRRGTVTVFALGGIFALIAYNLVETALLNSSMPDFDTEMEGMFSFDPPEIPRTFPTSLDFEVEDMKTGASLNLEETFDGKVVFLNTWATWCPPCVAELPSIEALYEKLGDKISFVCISNEERETILSFLEKKNYSLPVFRIKENLPIELETDSIPATFVISPNRECVMKHIGGANWADESVVTFLEGLLRESSLEGVVTP